MKKTYDWSVRLHITISNSQRKIQIVTSVHTNVHQLKIQICKTLSLPILDTQIEVYHHNSRALKPTSTLLQNQIQSDAHLTANIVRTKPTVRLPVEEKANKTVGNLKQKEEVQNGGLTVVSSCTNHKCINHNQLVQISYGFGNFSILELTAFAKCQICPYKSQNLRPNMLTHEVRVERCFYQLKGTALNSCNIPIPHQTPFLKTTPQRNIHRLLGDNPWHIDMQLIVKQL